MSADLPFEVEVVAHADQCEVPGCNREAKEARRFTSGDVVHVCGQPHIYRGERAAKSEYRDVAVEFMRLTPTSLLEIARKLGLDDGLDEMQPRDASLEVCRRVQREGCFDEFAGLVHNPASSREPTS